MPNEAFRIDKYTLGKWICVFINIYISGILIFLVNNIWISILAIAFMCIFSMFIVNIDILHPYTWLAPFYMLYSISNPILIMSGEVVIPGYDMLYDTMALQWLAFSVLIIVIGPRAMKFDLDLSMLKSTEKISKMILIFSTIISGIFLMYIIESGFQSKYQVKLNSSFLDKFSTGYLIFTVASACYLAYMFSIKRKVPYLFLLFSLVWTFMAVIFFGERDIFLRQIWMIFFVAYYFYKKMSNKLVAIYGVAGLFSVQVLASLKNFAMRGSVYSYEYNIWYMRIFNSEFVAAARNLQTMLIGFDNWHLWWGQTILVSIERIFLPKSILSGFSESATRLFNNFFFPELVARGGGNGFSLVAEGYMNFGVLGVIAWFMFLGLFLKYIYRKANSNAMWLIIYILTMPLVIYVLRADFTNLFSQFTKYILIPVVLIIKISNIKKDIKKQIT
jgi:oligosaccharide repeat unit polymerase